jgi:hypothetical protein
MSQFDLLLVAHLIGDFLFQTKWMADNKASRWIPLLTHVTVYTFVIAVFGWMSGGLSYWGLALIYVGHIILDRRTFVDFWVRRIQMAIGPEKLWLGIVTDQIFHLILIILAIYMTSVGIS